MQEKLAFLLLLIIFLQTTTANEEQNELKRQQEQHKASDVDKDGFIGLQEFETYYQSYREELGEEEWQKIKMDFYLSFDTDADEKVSVEELSVIYQGDQNFAEEGYIEENYEGETIDEETLKRQWWLKGEYQEEGAQDLYEEL